MRLYSYNRSRRRVMPTMGKKAADHTNQSCVAGGSRVCEGKGVKITSPESCFAEPARAVKREKPAEASGVATGKKPQDARRRELDGRCSTPCQCSTRRRTQKRARKKYGRRREIFASLVRLSWEKGPWRHCERAVEDDDGDV